MCSWLHSVGLAHICYVWFFAELLKRLYKQCMMNGLAVSPSADAHNHLTIPCWVGPAQLNHNEFCTPDSNPRETQSSQGSNSSPGSENNPSKCFLKSNICPNVLLSHSWWLHLASEEYLAHFHSNRVCLNSFHNPVKLKENYNIKHFLVA